MRTRSGFAFYALLLMTALNAAAVEPMNLQDYMALTGPEPSAHITYGSAASQYVELFRPEGAGPFPVVVLVHGGCWMAGLEGITQVRNIAGLLVGQGIAVWSVEYRRVDEPGGGYPGTYLDMISAVDTLTQRADYYQLDVSRLVAIGHSAGGHLVRWLAGRARLPATSALYREHPFVVREVIALGNVGFDLQAETAHLAAACGTDVALLTGAATPTRPDVYADTSPSRLLPNGSHTVLVNGALDSIAPPASAQADAARVRQEGDAIDTLVLPNASHFDEVGTNSPAWQLILPVVRRAVGMDPGR